MSDLVKRQVVLLRMAVSIVGKRNNQNMEDKIADIIWRVKFDKIKPNLPFRIEEEEVNKIVQEIMKIVSKTRELTFSELYVIV